MSAGPSRQARRARARRTALAAAAASTLVLSACGGPKPLAKLTTGQQSQLDMAWTAVINATDTADLSELDRASRARTLYSACSPLDKSNALLAALSDACSSLYVTKKLDAVIPTKCARATAVCMRALDRSQTETSALSKALANLNTQAARVVTDAKCLAQLTTSAPQVEAWAKLSNAYSVYSLGVQQKATDIQALGKRQVAEQKALTGDPRTAAERMGTFRSACDLNEI